MASSARIEELEKKFNENPRRYFAPLANEYRKAGDVQQAIAICRTYVPQQPGHMSGHIVFGQALFEAGNHDEARGVFEAALALDPENLIALRHLGDIARESGDIGAARSWYGRVLDADPRNDEVSTLLTSLEAEQSNAGDGPATWMEINPEQTLELPPDILAPPARETAFSETTPARVPPSRAKSMGDLFGAGSTVAQASPSPDPYGVAPIDFGLAPDAPPPSVPIPAAPSAEFADYVDEAAKTVPTFVTETMAELYVQQGFYDQALAVYRQLLTQHPGDPKLADRIEQLRRESAPTPPRSAAQIGARADAPVSVAAASPRPSVREFFGELALRRPRARPDTPSSEPAVASAPAHDMPAHDMPAHDMPAHDMPAHDAPPTDGSFAAEAIAATPVVATPVAAAPAQPSSASGDVSPVGGVDTGLTDSPFVETYSAEFGASALVVPSDSDARTGLVETSDDRVDSLVMRPSGEMDPPGVAAIGGPGGFLGSESSEFDVGAFDAGDMSLGMQKVASVPSPAAAPAESPAESPAVSPPAEALVATGGPDEPARGAESAADPAATPTETVRAAMQTGSVNVLFPQHPVSAPDEAAAAALSSAFGGPSGKTRTPVTNRPARPAANELSLDSVFREPPAAAADPRRESTAFSFDQFFGETPPTQQSGGVATDASLTDALDVGSADAEQFSNWLSGLKKK